MSGLDNASLPERDDSLDYKSDTKKYFEKHSQQYVSLLKTLLKPPS